MNLFGEYTEFSLTLKCHYGIAAFFFYEEKIHDP